MKILSPVLLFPLAFLCGCSAEKPVYDPPKPIKRFSERYSLLLSVESTLATTPFDKAPYVASLSNLRNPFMDFKEVPVEQPKNTGTPHQPVVKAPPTVEEIFAEAIDLLSPRSILISPTTKILMTEEGSRRIGFSIEWTDTEDRAFKVTLVDISSGSYTLEYKGTKQRFTLRR